MKTKARISSVPAPSMGRAATAALALSLVAPGCGHVYAGHWRRGLIWSLALLLVVVPLVIVAAIVWSYQGPGLLIWLLLGVFAFLATCAAGAAGCALRGTPAEARPPQWVIEAYAATVVLLLTLELRTFLGGCLASVSVESSAFEPILGRGVMVTVLRSRYVRPVHEDILLIRAGSGTEMGRDPAAERLARVVARPGDSIELRSGRLLVNGMEEDLARAGQRWDLEQAGRAIVRRRLFGAAPPVLPVAPGGLQGTLDWTLPDWGPFSVPRNVFICLPDDETGEIGAPGGDRFPRRGLIVHKTDILGRVLF